MKKRFKTLKSRLKKGHFIGYIHEDFFSLKFNEVEKVIGKRGVKILTTGREGLIYDSLVLYQYRRTSLAKTFKGSVIIEGWLYPDIKLCYHKKTVYICWTFLSRGFRFNASSPLSLVRNFSTIKKVTVINKVRYEETAIIE